MRPRSIESVDELKKIGSTLQALDEELEKKQQQLHQEYQKKYEEISLLLEKSPNNDLLKHRQKALEESFQESIYNLATDRNNKDQEIFEKICTFMNNPENEPKYTEFKKEFSHVLKDLDDELRRRALLLNKDIESNVLEEVKNVDVLVFNIVNKIAAKDIIVNIDQLTVCVAMQLSSFTAYDLEKATTLANEISSHIVEAYMANKKVSYEMLAKKIEQIIDPEKEKNLFVPLLQAIKKPCLEYIRNKEFLYTNLYNAKTLEFQQRLRGEFYEKLIDQDQARIHIEQDMLNHLIKYKNPKDFYLTLVRLAIDEMDAKRRSIEQKDEQSITTFKQHQNEVFQRLCIELNTSLANYLRKEQMTDPAIKMLNFPEVQHMYMKIAVSGYVPQLSEDSSEYYSLTTKDVLKAFDEAEQKTHGQKSMGTADQKESVSANLSVVTPVDIAERRRKASLIKLNSYKEYIQNNDLHKLSLVLRYEFNISTLEQLKKEIETDPSKKSYIDVINDRIKYVNSHQNSLTKCMFTPEAVSEYHLAHAAPAPAVLVK